MPTLVLRQFVGLSLQSVLMREAQVGLINGSNTPLPQLDEAVTEATKKATIAKGQLLQFFTLAVEATGSFSLRI